jgi:hypothetical protein
MPNYSKKAIPLVGGCYLLDLREEKCGSPPDPHSLMESIRDADHAITALVIVEDRGPVADKHGGKQFTVVGYMPEYNGYSIDTGLVIHNGAIQCNERWWTGVIAGEVLKGGL